MSCAPEYLENPGHPSPDPSIINVECRGSKVKVQYWNYSIPNDNGDSFFSCDLLKINPNNIGGCKKELQNLIDRSLFEVTHVIFPHIPDWSFSHPEITLGICLRGKDHHYGEPKHQHTIDAF